PKGGNGDGVAKGPGQTSDGGDEESAAEGGAGGPRGADRGAVADPSAPVPPSAALTDSPPVIPARLEGLDLGPACSQCGGMMQRTGSCYTCSSCGNNTGCS